MLQLSPFISAYIIFLTALLGLAMGSFLGCAASRMAKGESALKGRSHCDFCGHVLSAGDLIPVFSWLFSGGRCRYCHEKLPVGYVVEELVCAAVYVSVLLRFDVSWEALMWLGLLSPLFAASLVDLEIQLIPDRFLAIPAVAFFPLAYLCGGPPLLLRGLIGAAALFLPMLGLVLLYDRRAGKESMGGGDLKLIALLGLYFGWKQGLLLMIVACVFGLLFAGLRRAKKGAAIPFGPALSAAAWFTVIFGDGILNWYLGLF